MYIYIWHMTYIFVSYLESCIKIYAVLIIAHLKKYILILFEHIFAAFYLFIAILLEYM